ncbi:ATP-binding cassette domain-containing protein [Helicobacter sp. 11S03491-1]|uniref:ATP-binding cassette domain-containing protein n=1 Tax=Helicobacter sp. 11S03491-1 TaxID=1476196 RepID=UPI000BA78A19|nr:ATP-binding cassette domain-containing protein [Helicobacter sp. 11S03491-1]PAF41567.1 hypothetical protein BKH45_06605 [Helicobacter sp. 11S03491-1]
MIVLDFEKKLYGTQGEFVLRVQACFPMGEFISIFGKSGVGKTTILRILSGLETPNKGKIIVGDKVYFDSEKNINLDVQKRKIGFVFQDYALFPHLNVYKNITFGKNNQADVDKIISLMELEPFCQKKISMLSGGQAQRVAIARALASSPDILLLDEPLSAIDGELRLKLQVELKNLSKHFGVSSFLVSHDLGEVFRLSDRVICIENGKISKIGTPDEVFVNKHLSGRIQISGEILKITKSSIVCIADVLIHHAIIRVILSGDEAKKFKVGDCVGVITKAFNPSLVML